MRISDWSSDVCSSDLAMRLAGKGTNPADCSPVSLIAGDQRYRISVEVTLDGAVEAGLLLFYSRRLYAGLGMDRDGLVLHRSRRQRRAGPSGTAKIGRASGRARGGQYVYSSGGAVSLDNKI